MVIGIVVDNEFTNDPRVNNEVRLLLRAGYRLKILCFSFGKYPKYENLGNQEVFRISIGRKIKDVLFAIMNIFPVYHWFWAYHIKKFIKMNGLEILHVHDLYMARAAGLVTKKYNTKLILDLHENYPEAILGYKWATKFPNRLIVNPGKWKRMEGKYLSYANSIITLSHDFANELLIKYPDIQNKQLVVFPNVPDIGELLSFPVDQNILPKENRFILFYFGGISERRGIFTCIEALELLKKDIPRITLLLIGPIDGNERDKFHHLINDPKLKDHIIYINWTDIKFLPSYISISDICLSPILKNRQHESGVANKVFQYLLFGKPIIVSNCKPQVDVVERGSCGLVFESGNCKSLAESILMLYKDESLRQEMGRKGRQLVINEYNVDVYRDNLLSLYKESN